VTSVEALIQVAADFVIADLDLAAEPAAAAAAQQSLDDSGLLLLGEMHGARENPLLARALMQAFGITRLASEWDEDLAPVTEAFLATGTLADHWLLWPGDGRITAGHLAVLAERAAAGPVEVICSTGPSAPSGTGRIAMRRWPGACWPPPRRTPARWQSPGARTLPPAPSSWAPRWAPG